MGLEVAALTPRLLILLLCSLALFLGPAALAQGKDAAPEPEGGEGGEEDEDEFVIVDSPFEDLEVRCIEYGNPHACFEAGNRWFEGRGIEKPSLTQAVNLWAAGCSFGHAESCFAAAKLYLSGRTGVLLLKPDGRVSHDLGTAERHLSRACELGHLEACSLLGELHMAPKAMLPRGGTWHDFKPDMVYGRLSYETGCPRPLSRDELEPGPANLLCCTRLAQMYEEGGGGVRRDRDEALLYWDLACKISEGEGDSCDRLDLLQDEQPTPESEAPRVSIQPRRPTPRVERFADPSTGVTGSTLKDHGRRWEVELGVGARWTYGPNPVAGMKLRLGTAVWFNWVGIALESGFMTDRFVMPAERSYMRFQHGLGLKFGGRLPIRLPWNAAMFIVAGAGGTLGSLKLHPEPFVLSYGAREHIQLVLGTGQERGPRQWGALRIEQQQTWHVGGGSSPEHSTQVVIIAGFVFGGWGPEPGRRPAGPE